MRTTRSTAPKKPKREKYTEQRPRLQDALDEYYAQQAFPEKERLSKLELVVKHQIRKSLFYQLIKNGTKKVPDKKPGKEKVLPYSLQCMLAVWIMVQQAVGCAVSPFQVRKKAAQLEKMNKTGEIQPESETKPKSKTWFSGFRKAFAFLGLRKVSNLETDRAQAANPSVIRTFFTLLLKVLAKFKIVTIWNMDESFVQIAKIKGKWKVFGLVGSKNAYKCTSKFSEHVTLIACVSNEGHSIPPVLIFKGKKMEVDLVKEGPEGSAAIMSEKG
jgi:hypothetical protein